MNWNSLLRLITKRSHSPVYKLDPNKRYALNERLAPMLPNTIIYIYNDLLRSQMSEPQKKSFARILSRYNIRDINKVRYIRPSTTINLLNVLAMNYPQYKDLIVDVLNSSIEESK